MAWSWGNSEAKENIIIAALSPKEALNRIDEFLTSETALNDRDKRRVLQKVLNRAGFSENFKKWKTDGIFGDLTYQDIANYLDNQPLKLGSLSEWMKRTLITNDYGGRLTAIAERYPDVKNLLNEKAQSKFKDVNEITDLDNLSAKKVRELQTHLYISGLYKGKIDGDAGPKTKEAFSKYLASRTESAPASRGIIAETNTKTTLLEEINVSDTKINNNLVPKIKVGEPTINLPKATPLTQKFELTEGKIPVSGLRKTNSTLEIPPISPDVIPDVKGPKLAIKASPGNPPGGIMPPVSLNVISEIPLSPDAGLKTSLRNNPSLMGVFKTSTELRPFNFSEAIQNSNGSFDSKKSKLRIEEFKASGKSVTNLPVPSSRFLTGTPDPLDLGKNLAKHNGSENPLYAKSPLKETTAYRGASGYGVPSKLLEDAKTPQSAKIFKAAASAETTTVTNKKGVLVIIDLGHGEKDKPKGAMWGKLAEKDVADAVGLQLAEKLYKEGFNVAFTREPGEIYQYNHGSKSIGKRIEFSGRLAELSGGRTYLLSLHANASPDPKASGTWIMAGAENNKDGQVTFGGPLINQNSMDLANVMKKHLTYVSKSPSIKTADPDLLPGIEHIVDTKGRRSIHAALMIEMGFVRGDNAALTKLVNDPAAAATFAGQMVQGLKEYHAAHPPVDPENKPRNQIPVISGGMGTGR